MFRVADAFKGCMIYKEYADGWIRRAITKLKAYWLDLYLDDCFGQAESLNVLIAEGEQMLQKAADNFCNSAKTEQQRGLKT